MARFRPLLGAWAASLVVGCSLLVDTAGLGGPPVDGGADGGDGGSDATADTADAAPQCGETRADAFNCGRCGHSCAGDPCVDGACVPTPIAATPDKGGYGIAVDDASVYWSSTSARAVFKADKNAKTSAVVTLMSRPSPFLPLEVRVDGNVVGVVNSNSGDASPMVFRIATSGGGTPTGIGASCAIDGNGGLAFDTANAYVVNGRLGAVYRIAKGGGDCTPIAMNQPAPSNLAIDDTTVFFTSDDSPAPGSTLRSVSKKGGTPVPLATAALSGSVSTSLVVDGNAIVMGLADGRIVRLGKDGAGFAETVTGIIKPTGVVVDESNVYWVSSDEIWAADKLGGKPRLVASAQFGASLLALDRDRLYWVTETAVMRVAK